MPHVAFKCPDPQMWHLDNATMLLDDTVDIPICLNCSLTRHDRECNWDYADLSARVEDNGSYTGGLFTPSRFNGCDRELFLRRTQDYWTDPAEQTSRVRGTRVHAGQQTEVEGIISEVRVYRTLEGITWPDGRPVVVDTQPDKVYPLLGVIHDDKTWSYLPRGGEGYKVGEIHPVEVGDDWRVQLSVGAWCWAKPNHAFTADGYLLNAGAPIEITEGQITVRDGKGQKRIPGIELYPFAELEDFMRSRAKQIMAAAAGHEPSYHPHYCATCPVRPQCGIPKELYERKPRAKPASRSRR